MRCPIRLLPSASFAVFLLLSIRDCRGLAQQSNKKKGAAATTTKSSSAGQQFFSKLQSQLPFPKQQQQNDPQNKNNNVLDQLNLENNYQEPKTFGFLPSQIPDLLTAAFPAVMRLGTGVFAEGYRLSLGPKDDSRYTLFAFGNSSQIRETSDIQYSKQNLPLILYEFEGCPFCRKVREAVSILSLEVTFHPCPQGERVFRNDVKTKYGDASSTFPFLIDPNTGVQMFESDDIINYLFRVYGTPKSKIPWTLTPSSPWVTLSAGLGLLPRAGRGGRYRSSDPPPEPLIFWSYEGSPYCKLVRERLVELGLAHTQISCPRGSFQRDRLFAKTGERRLFQVPYLEDPNTGVALFESAAIIEYVEKVYGLPEPRVKYI